MSDSEGFYSDLEDSSSSSESDVSSHRRTSAGFRQLTVNISDTKYSVIRHVLRKKLGWHISKDPESAHFDLWWTDGAVEPEKLARMQLFQKINHFPGMYALAKKNFLARNLNKLRKVFPDEFGFYPQTWVLPAEFADLKTHALKKPNSTYIVKPEAMSQGKGIFLSKDVDELSPIEHYIVQTYIDKPFLIEGLKFDLRIYVLLAGCDPLRIYVHEEGLARLATEDYEKPNEDNMDDICMHLTNYAVNKFNPNFIFNEDSEEDDIGHKRSLASIWRLLSDLGFNVELIRVAIHDVIIKTLCTVQPSIAHSYKSCQPEDASNGMCFELLGFDILLDRKAKPWLLEVNHSPSFTTDTPLDEKIKRKVIGDTIALLNFSAKRRRQFIVRTKNIVQLRALHGKQTKMNKEEKEVAYRDAQRKRDDWEDRHLGGFTKIYPVANSEHYETFLKVALSQWQDWTGGNISRLRPPPPKREDPWLRLKAKCSHKHNQSLPHNAGGDSALQASCDTVRSTKTKPESRDTASTFTRWTDQKQVVRTMKMVRAKIKQAELSIHPMTLPNIFFSDAVSQQHSRLPISSVLLQSSDMPMKDRQYFPQKPVLQTPAKRQKMLIEKVLRPVGKAQTYMADKSPKHRCKKVFSHLCIKQRVSSVTPKRLM